MTNAARVLACLLVVVSPAFAATGGVPVSVAHQGYLLNAADAPLEATIGLKFRVFGVFTGGAAEWEGTCPTVVVRAGYYSTLLGGAGCAGTAGLGDTVLDTSDLPVGAARWLEVVVGTTVLVPRLPISPVATASLAAHALDADTLQGQSAAAFAAVNHTHTSSHVTDFEAAVEAAIAGGVTVPNAAFEGPVVTSITTGTGLSVVNPGGAGAATLELSGALLTGLDSNDGLVATNPSGPGNASYALQLADTSLTVGPSGLSVNLGNANTWTGPQSFTGGLGLDGNLGIGTPTPGQLLHLNDPSGDAAVRLETLLPATSAGSVTFNHVANAQSFTVPDGVTAISVDVRGAEGGTGNAGAAPGKGARVQASIPVTPGEVLTIHVGGPGCTGGFYSGNTCGGYNGGGQGGGGVYPGAGGGGASDVRRGAGLAGRVVVAGGGGGSGGSGTGGGAGGQPSGDAGVSGGSGKGSPGGGGSQGGGGGGGAGFGNGGGAGSTGASGQGGAAGAAGSGFGGGGGGGGWNGGGGGGGSYHTSGGATGGGGGGGGSSWSAATNTGVTFTTGYQAGNGVVVISWGNAPASPINWTLGVDRSDHGKLKASLSDTVGSGPSLELDLGGNLKITGKLTAPGGVDPPYVSFSDETHASIRARAAELDPHEKVMQFWNAAAHRMEVYVVAEDRFFTLGGDLVTE